MCPRFHYSSIFLKGQPILNFDIPARIIKHSGLYYATPKQKFTHKPRETLKVEGYC